MLRKAHPLGVEQSDGTLMNLFQSPPVTRYDLNFTIAGIKIRVHPLFWLMALVFGASSSNIMKILVWIIVVFVSILLHELGHAMVMRAYGQNSHIVLYLAGGLTIPESLPWGNRIAYVSLSRKQEIFVSLAGPATGFLFTIIMIIIVNFMGGSIFMSNVYGLIPFPYAYLPIGGIVVNEIVMTLIWVNIFWGLINLMPVYPLDGGNISRNLLTIIDPLNGGKNSLWVSAIAGGIVAIFGLLVMNSIYITYLFGMLAYQSYQTVQGKVELRY